MSISDAAVAADNRAALYDLIRVGLDEDLGAAGDITSAATIAADAILVVRYVAREAGVMAGALVLEAVVAVGASPRCALEVLVEDAEHFVAGAVLAQLSGPARDILAIERLSLNLLGRLCGIATMTKRWVDAVEGTGARIRDTRKTTPGLRDLEKYAVRCGGGVNHRNGLYDAVLIKDNHVAAAGGVGAVLDQVRAANLDPAITVQIEVDDLAQLDEALDHGATDVLLDNFTIADLRTAVAAVRERSVDVRLEASGGLQLATAAEVAATGVDYLAVGALTHSVQSLDIGLDVASIAAD